MATPTSGAEISQEAMLLNLYKWQLILLIRKKQLQYECTDVQAPH